MNTTEIALLEEHEKIPRSDDNSGPPPYCGPEDEPTFAGTDNVGDARRADGDDDGLASGAQSFAIGVRQAALRQTGSGQEPTTTIGHIPLVDLHSATLHPRRNDDGGGEIQGLVESIRQHGVLQPILVRPRTDKPSGYEIVCGERRWRAALIAGLDTVPAIVREFADGGVLIASLVENLERRELTALEEADGYRRLIEEFQLTQANLATLLGRSRSAVANSLRLLDLPERVKDALQAGVISAGHARALMGASDPERMLRDIIANELSVRETERLVGRAGAQRQRTATGLASFDADVVALERTVSGRLGLRATMARRRDGGTITLHYKNLRQLDDFLVRLEALGEVETNEIHPLPLKKAV